MVFLHKTLTVKKYECNNFDNKKYLNLTNSLRTNESDKCMQFRLFFKTNFS